MCNNGEAKVVLEAKDVTKFFNVSQNRKLCANDKVNLTMYEGQTLGIVGESGCGKSTLAKLLIQIEAPTEGEILFKGKNVANLTGEALRQQRKHIQMVFQNPGTAFNPKMKVKNIICEPLLNYGLIKKKEVEQRAIKLLEMVELDSDFANRYPHNMSGGQCQRVGIARALALEPEILICDEATSALDVSVQKNIIDFLIRLQKQKGTSIAFICHDIALVRSLSHQILIMYLGNAIEMIPGAQVGKTKMHPYTNALIDSIFSIDMDFTKPLESMDSEIPSPLNVPPGCPFQNRCTHCMEICKKQKPTLKEVEANHKIACHLF